MSMTELMYWYSLHTDMWREDQHRQQQVMASVLGGKRHRGS